MEVHCVCLLCEKEVATASRDDSGDYYFGENVRAVFSPMTEHLGKHPFDETAPMDYWDKMQVNIIGDHWSESPLVLVIGYCQKCIKKKFKNVINKHQFIGNVHQKSVKRIIRRKKKKVRK